MSCIDISPGRDFSVSHSGKDGVIPIGWDVVVCAQPLTDLDRSRIAQCELQLMNLSVHVYAICVDLAWRHHK